MMTVEWKGTNETFGELTTVHAYLVSLGAEGDFGYFWEGSRLPGYTDTVLL